jgi:outer membrane lipoprotein carrier protein
MQNERTIKGAIVNRLIGIFVLAAFSGVMALPSFAADPKAMLNDLQRIYDSSKDLSARFVQTSHLAAAGMDREVRGKVVFKKGGKMRWTYEGDDPQEIVSDGKTLWIYQVRDKNVMRQDLRKLPAANRLGLDLLSGFQGAADTFHLSACGESCLELKPRQTRPDINRILLDLDPKTREVKAVTTEDGLGNRTRVELREVRWNIGAKDDLFTFKVPRGVEVLEMPGEGG